MDPIKNKWIELYEYTIEYKKYKNQNPNRARYFRETIDSCLQLYSDVELIQLIENSTVDDNTILDCNPFLNFLAKTGDFSSMYIVLKQLSNNLDQLKSYLNSALLDAVQYVDNLDMVKILVQFGNVDINCTEKFGNSPLHWAIFGACSDIIRYLVYKGANIDSVNELNETPLHWCAVRYDVHRKFIGVDSEIKYWNDKLIEAAIKKRVYLAIAMNMINDSFADTSIKNSQNKTAVSIIQENLMANMNFNEEQKLTILNNIFPYKSLEISDDNCLLISCKATNLLQIEYLLNNNEENIAMLTKTDGKNQTGLHCLISAFNYHQNHNARKKLKFDQIMKRYIDLVNGEFLTEVKDTENGDNVFHYAVKYGNGNVARSILKKCGFRVMDQKNNNGYYGIHLASANNQIETIRLLFDSGDDLNKTDETGNADTPLMLAVLESNCDAVELLVNCGTDVNKTDKFGFPPIFPAIDDWFREVQKEKLPITATRIKFWYGLLTDIGFKNCVNIAIACYLINDCNSRLDTSYLETVSAGSIAKMTKYVNTGEEVLGNVVDLLKYRIKTERKNYTINETQIEFLHRYIVSINNSSNIVYRNLSLPRGLCVIINNYDVIGETTRVGSEVDTKNLIRLFDEYKYTVEPHVNLEAEMMRNLFEEQYACSDKLKDFDSLVVIVMSHGGQETIMGSDGISVNIRELIELFNNENCPHLKQKPKIFIIQACRGDQKMSGVDPKLFDGPGSEYSLNVRNVSIPHMTDVIICYATVFGYKAIRTEFGAWYCQAMCEVLEKKLPNTDLLTQLQMIDKKVQLKTLHENKNALKQITSYENIGFNKKFFFNI